MLVVAAEYPRKIISFMKTLKYPHNDNAASDVQLIIMIRKICQNKEIPMTTNLLHVIQKFGRMSIDTPKKVNKIRKFSD